VIHKVKSPVQAQKRIYEGWLWSKWEVKKKP